MYREIVTKAVIGKGKITNISTVTVSPANGVSKILGCWIINHYYVNDLEGDKVFAKGRYDVHLWYGCNNDSDTLIHKQTIDYVEEFNVKMKDNEAISDSNEFIIRNVKYPTCNGLTLNDDGTVAIKVEKELTLDIIGDAKLRVQVSDTGDVNEDIENSVNVNYLNKE